jgi:hypothetical protein
MGLPGLLPPSVSNLQRPDSFERKSTQMPKNAALAAGFALRVGVAIWVKSSRQGGSSFERVRVSRGGLFEDRRGSNQKIEGAGK